MSKFEAVCITIALLVIVLIICGYAGLLFVAATSGAAGVVVWKALFEKPPT